MASDSIRKIKYPMLADPTGALARAFGVYIESEGMAYRGTFLINPEGQIKVARCMIIISVVMQTNYFVK